MSRDRMCLVVITLLFFLIRNSSGTGRLITEDLIFKRHNGYYYSVLSTPNYPHEFQTPFNRKYIIPKEYMSAFRKPLINMFINELHVEYIQFPYLEADGWHYRNATIDHTVLGFTTEVQIEVNIRDLYAHHFRSSEHYINTFGFNISIQIMENDGIEKNGCSIRGCNFAGVCRSSVGNYSLESRCDCMPEFSGLSCEHGPKCDLQKNINFCLNGGTCRVYGLTGEGNCACPPGYSGSACRVKPPKTNFVAENKDCLSTDLSQGNDRPCSLCNRYNGFKDEKRYLVIGTMLNSDADFNLTLQSNFPKPYDVRSNNTLNVPKSVVLELYAPRWSYNSSNVSSNGIKIQPSDSINNSTSYVKMKPEILFGKKRPLTAGENFSLTCICQVPPGSNSIAFKWFKDNAPINTSFIERHLTKTEESYSRGKEIWSILMFDEATGMDNGVFTCQVTDLTRNVQECIDFELWVVAVPVIEVLPMTATVIKNGSVALTCTSPALVQMNWYQDGEIINPEKDGSFKLERTHFKKGLILRVLNAQSSMKLECRASNMAGKSSRVVDVVVLDNPYYSCIRTYENQIDFKKSWSLTGIGQIAMAMCPQGFMGFQQKPCLGEKGLYMPGVWGPTDFSRCTHNQLKQLNYTLHSMRNGFSVTDQGLAVFPTGLNRYLEARHQNQSTLLFGEGDKFIRMLTDTFDYFNQLRSKHVVEKDDVRAMILVVDKFMSFGYSCVHNNSVADLVEKLNRFIMIQEVEDFEEDNIYINVHEFSLENSNESNSLRLESNTTNIDLDFECSPNDNEKVRMYFIKLSDVKILNNDKRIISDIISVNTTTDCEYIKGNMTYEIEFDRNTIHQNLTCAGLFDHVWRDDVCTLEVSQYSVKCICMNFGIFAILTVRNELEIRPVTNELKAPLPDWIAISGCIVCLVLCFRTLTNVLISNKYHCPYFIATTLGIIFSILCLLCLIFTTDSKTIGFLYLSSTLVIKSLRIWKMICLDDMHVLYPWLKDVSRWILLAGISISWILPLFTVCIFDIIYADTGSILCQTSPVFIAFGILVALSFLTIVFVYYKTFLWIHRNRNCSTSGNETGLDENLFHAVIHLIQVLSFFLYWNFKYNLWCHYGFFIFTSVLGLSWRSPRYPPPVSQQSIKHDADGSVCITGGTTTTTTECPNTAINETSSMEMDPMLELGQKCDQNEHDPCEGMGTVPIISKIRPIPKDSGTNGPRYPGMENNKAGQLIPFPAKCFLSDYYVYPTPKPDFTKLQSSVPRNNGPREVI